eukprot:56002_1
MAFTFSAIAIVGFMCIISCTQMVLFDLEWDASGLFLKMKFNSSVNVNISSCNTSILDLNIRKIVSQYSIFHCIWYSNRILYMYPSYNSTFNSISIPSSSVYNYNPYIILQAPTMINPCFNLIVSIKQSFNNGGRSLKYKWEINNSTEWNVPLDESKLFLPNYYLSNFIDSYLEIKLICSNWLGLSTTIFHTIYVQLISYCDSSLGYILINNGNKQQLQPNWNNYPLSISIHSNINTDTKTNDYFSIKWYQIFTPNSMGNNFKQFNFNFKTKFSADTIEWNYENDFDNTTILLPIFSTKQSNDYIFSVEVCDVDKNTLLCLWDYVFIRSKYPTPEPIKTKSQIEYINPRIKTEYTFNINTFFNFHPRYLLEYNNDFNLIYNDEENEYLWDFDCIGITTQGYRLKLNCFRSTGVNGIHVSGFQSYIITKKKIFQINMTASLIISDDFISIYDLQTQKKYPSIIKSHTITFFVTNDIVSTQLSLVGNLVQLPTKYSRWILTTNFENHNISIIRNNIDFKCISS